MRLQYRRTAISLLLLVLLAAAPSVALPVEATVGSGGNTANIVIEFGDSASFLFEVLFSGTEISGIDALSVIETALTPTFLVDLIDFGPVFGFSVDGVTYGAHSNVGFVDPDGFWHYWTKEAELDSWAFSSVGGSFRMLQDGSWDGWKYGSGSPVPEPGTAALLAIGLALLGFGRARVRAQSSVA